jgi:hypothetical protein
VTDFLNLKASGLGEWMDPEQAAAADAGSQMRLQAALIATRNVVLVQWWNESDARKERKLKAALDEMKATGFMLSSLLNAGKAW